MLTRIFILPHACSLLCFLLCKLFISLLYGLFLADYGKRKILPFFLEKSGYLCKELEEYVKI